MGDGPRTRYVASGGAHIAYQVIGDGPVDLVWVIGGTTHLEAEWEDPAIARLWTRLAGFSRLIRFDTRGTGMSDPVPPGGLPTLEQRMDDLRAVLDAVDSHQPTIVGETDGGPTAVVMAATYPERVRSLILYGTYARLTRTDGYDVGWPEHVVRAFTKEAADEWGTGVTLRAAAPSLAGGPFAARWGRHERLATSPGQFEALMQMVLESDVRHLLPLVRVPTLVLHRGEDVFIPAACGRWMADHIDGAVWREVPGGDHLPFAGDVDTLVGEIEEFTTGRRGHGDDDDRVLTTVMCTEVTDAHGQAVRHGDRAWADLLIRHDELVARELERFRGTLVSGRGAQAMGWFDGPARAIRCAAAIRDGVAGLGLVARAGVHTGEVRRGDGTFEGTAVVVARALRDYAQGGEVVVSGSVPPLVAGSGLRFRPPVDIDLDGGAGRWAILALDDGTHAARARGV